MNQTHVTVGSNDDLEYLTKCAQGGSAGNWPVRESANVGDRVVMLIPAVYGPFRACGRVAGPPVPGMFGKKHQHFAPIDKLVRLTPPVPVAVVQQALPQWKYLGYAKSYTKVPVDFCDDFWKILTNPPIASDVDSPERVESVVTRIVRDTATACALKRKYDFKCQVCGARLLYGHGQYYIEVHHIWPLGRPHKGRDIASNMLVLCPNHHALFDLRVPVFLDSGTIEIAGKKLKLKSKHQVSQKSIDYYMKRVRHAAA